MNEVPDGNDPVDRADAAGNTLRVLGATTGTPTWSGRWPSAART